MAWNSVANIKGPKGDTGNTGSQGIQGIQGVAGTAGSAGSTGARGSKWFTGSGAPSNPAGAVIGDMYLDTVSGDIYVLS